MYFTNKRRQCFFKKKNNKNKNKINTIPTQRKNINTIKYHLNELGGLDSGALLVEDGNRCLCSSLGVFGRQVSNVRSDERAALTI